MLFNHLENNEAKIKQINYMHITTINNKHFNELCKLKYRKRDYNILACMCRYGMAAGKSLSKESGTQIRKMLLKRITWHKFMCFGKQEKFNFNLRIA